MTHPSNELFDAMRAVIEAPDFELLTSYQQDFYVLDREILQTCWAPDMRYLWVVRDMGTHLYPLGLDNRTNDEASAALGILGRGQQAYLLQNNTVVPITHGQARELIKKLNYEVINGFLMKNGDRNLGHMRVDLTWVKGQLKGSVQVESSRPVDKLSVRDRIALQRNAVAQVIAKSQSLFTPCISVTYNGAELFEPVTAKVAAAPTAEPVQTEEAVPA